MRSRRKKQKTMIPQEIAEILLDIFVQKTNFPIILFEVDTDDLIQSESSSAHFDDFCKYAHTCGLLEQCNKDHHKRAIECTSENITTCWLGLVNAGVPVLVNENRRAVLLYGQSKLDDPTWLQESQKIFDEALPRLKINETQRTRLREKFEAIRRVEKDDIDPKVLTELRNVNRFLYTIIYEKMKIAQEKAQIEDNIKHVNHELSISLQAALADAEILWMMIDPGNRELKGDAKTLLFALQHMNGVLQNYKEFLGKPDFVEMDLGPILETCVSIYEPLAESKNVSIKLSRTDSSPFPRLKLSEIHIELALQNLLHNAVKYSHRGFHRASDNPITVDIIGYRKANQYHLEIQNFGVGILPSELESNKVFEAGYRGKLTEQEGRTGGGFGLTKAKEILEQHNATILIRSRETAGGAYLTTVEIVFPLA